MADETFEKVKGILVEYMHVDAEKVTPEARFIEDLEADSLGMVELLQAMEDEFGLTIPDEDAEKLITVKDAVDYIESKA
jgi:acyl carrier protein